MGSEGGIAADVPEHAVRGAFGKDGAAPEGRGHHGDRLVAGPRRRARGGPAGHHPGPHLLRRQILRQRVDVESHGDRGDPRPQRRRGADPALAPAQDARDRRRRCLRVHRVPRDHVARRGARPPARAPRRRGARVARGREGLGVGPRRRPAILCGRLHNEAGGLRDCQGHQRSSECHIAEGVPGLGRGRLAARSALRDQPAGGATGGPGLQPGRRGAGHPGRGPGAARPRVGGAGLLRRPRAAAEGRGGEGHSMRRRSAPAGRCARALRCAGPGQHQPVRAGPQV
mmetsp:Transcript_78346/g.239654  ORF Transcript_78346/g.239654 Transcript_78346/m.239654 type:complete len:285 (-) Transcript_78346:1961-2815(-)